MPRPGDELIDAKIEEVDRLLEELRKRRQELQGAKEATETGKTSHKASEPPSEPAVSEAGLEETLNSLEWKSFRKREGEWAFLRDREGRLRDELKPVKEFVDQLRKSRDAVVGRYRYAVSDDRFLNRFLS